MKTAREIVETVRLSPYKFAAVALTNLMSIPIKSSGFGRDALPEPFDVMDHIGNVGQSAMWGAGAGYFAGMAMEYHMEKTGREFTIRKARAGMAVAGFAVGAVLNGFIESKTGMGLAHWQNTADPIDVIYGTVAATTAAAMLPDFETREESNTANATHSFEVR